MTAPLYRAWTKGTDPYDSVLAVTTAARWWRFCPDPRVAALASRR